MQMRFFVLSAAALVFIASVFGCNSNETLVTRNSNSTSQTPAPATPPPDNARRITAEDLYKLYEKNAVLIIATRAESAYKQEHIKGSVSMPAGTVLSHLDELPRDKTIVAYCT